jgi:hypothetical protein
MIARYVVDSDVDQAISDGWSPAQAASPHSILMTKPDERTEEERAVDLFISSVIAEIKAARRLNELGEGA